MDWYGLWMVGGTLAFFSWGGKSLMQKAAHSRVRSMERGARAHTVPPVDLVDSEGEKAD